MPPLPLGCLDQIKDRDLGQSGESVRVLPEEVSLTRSLWLIVHQDLAELARIKAVVRFIRDEVAAGRATFRLD